MNLIRFAGIIFLLTALSGCSVPRIVNEYKIDIQQGNVLTQEMVSQLKPGQTRDQVRFILGTPMLTDPFHENRWDYVYSLKKGSDKEAQMRKFSVYFDADGKLYRVAGDVTAAQAADNASQEQAAVQEIDLGSIDADAPVPESNEPGFFGRMLENIGW